MYSVLLVDDEKCILDSIQNTVPWEAYGIDRVLEAHNGLEALDVLSRHTVNLLITDIKMPGMDGLILLKKVRNLYPGIRCILLSAFGEFEYARTALQLGIENYLLKPLSVDELTASIEKSLENIEQRKQIDQNLFYDNILLRWISGTISEDELIERTPVLNVNLYSRNYCVIILRRQKPNTDMVKASTMFSNALNGNYSVYSLTENQDNQILILAAHEIEPAVIYEHLEAVQPAADPDKGLLIAVGSVVFENMELSKSYNDAQSTLRYAALFSVAPIAVFDDTYHSRLSQTSQKRIRNLLDLPTVEAAVDEGISMIEDLFLYKSNYQEMQRLAGEVGAVLLTMAHEYLPKGNTAQLENLVANLYNLPSGPISMERYRSWFETLIAETWLRHHSNIGNISPVVHQALRYIRDHYSGSVSIKEFCAKFEVNASYLGYLFKNETGVFFNDYVSRVRIKRATWLLENTNDKIAEIADQVGFSNVSYFIKCFRSKTGVSPVKYRQLKTNPDAEVEIS